ncbi:MAG: DNA polymerase III subunit delta [Verrucomicrobiaceae bacterium]|nr:MAG: DNA polymerase III subunit delta [Verrucomicrobiaceae bacterium]
MAAKAKPSSPGAGNFFAVIGSDDGLVREKALELYNQLTGGSDDGFTHETIDGIADNSDSAFEICSSTVEALQTLPMFGGDKVVWLRNANFLGDNVTGRSQRTEAGVDRLRATLEAGVPDGVKFLLTAQGVDKRRSFWKFIEKAAEVQSHDRIDTSRDDWQDQVAALVTKRAAELGLDFEKDALEIFVMLAGEQTQQIGNELEKLDLYLGPERRTITEDDVNRLVPLSRAAVVFEIGKAIQQGNAARAIQLIDQQLEADESAIGIMRASIIGTVRNLYMARLIIEKFKAPTGNYNAFSGVLNRLPEADRAWLPQKKDGSGVNVYPIFLAAAQAAHFELDALQDVLEATLKADQALVTTGLDHRLILHRLIVEIASARKSPPSRAR